MPATVPTSAEFAALEARVAALEQARPPEPGPDPNPGEGVQAKRIASLVELFGINTFSSMDEHNLWGSYPADYRPESVISALSYLTAGTRFCLRIREYHYRGREDFQTPWLQQITTAFPATNVTICVGANGTEADVPSMAAMDADWLEGLNEPNTDFGQGMVPLATTQAIQHQLTLLAPVGSIMGPSIVAGMPGPEGWIYDYCGTGLDQLNRQMGIGNGHYYPPHCPDLVGDGTSLSEYVGGLWTAYAQHPIAITEFHPSLYNSAGHKPDEPGWNGERDAYYTLLALFRAAKCGVVGLWWYALYDYGTTYRCGLFPKTGAEQPRPAAAAIRNLCLICADRGADLRTFQPGALAVTLSGPTGQNWDWDLQQGSDGTYFIPLWRAAPEMGGDSVVITLALQFTPRSIEMFDVVTGAEVSFADIVGSDFIINLDASCRMIVVHV